MRSKEDAQDYRYFPIPTCCRLSITEQDDRANRVEDAGASGSEAKNVRRRHGRDAAAQAAQLTSSREHGELLAIAALRRCTQEFVRIWRTGCVGPAERAAERRSDLDIAEEPVVAGASCASLDQRVADGTLSGKMAKEVFDAMWAGEGARGRRSSRSAGLKQISDSGAIEKIVDEALAANAKQVEDYRAGKEKAFNSLVGQVMKGEQGQGESGAGATRSCAAS